YTWGEGSIQKYDPGFGKVIEWDIPLLVGYTYTFEKNTAKTPGSHHFKGIKTPELISNIEKFSPDAILVFGWAYHSHLKVLRHFKGKIPIWFRGDSTLLDEQKGLKNLFKSYFLKWVYQHVDRAFYVGIANKLYFLKYGLKEVQLSFAPHAIDNERFGLPQIDKSKDLRKQLSIEEDELLFLFAGKMELKKNPMLLLQAFIELEQEGEMGKIQEDRAQNQEAGYKTEEVSDKKQGIHLLFLGNGLLEKSLKLKVESLELKKVHFMDFQNQSQMPVVYQACNVFCLPSFGPGETWGLAVNEAMASGKAVIVSDRVGCGKDLVRHGENGFIFKHDDVEALLRPLRYFIENPERENAFGEKSQTIIKNYTFEHIATSIITLLMKDE
ncbi:MAG: glycosyltransferase family 4 protein, partial [Pelobium sp.]